MIRSLPRLLLILVAVPLIAFGVSFAIAANRESKWQAELARQYPHVSVQERAAVTLLGMCADPKARIEIGIECGREDQLLLMRRVAMGAAAAGVGWLVLVGAAGRLARRDRRLLLRVFRPGLRLTAGFLTVLIAVHGVLAVAAVYLAEAALIERVHLGVIAAIAIGALFGVIAVGRAAFSVVRTVATTVVGTEVAPQDSPELWRFVEQTAVAVGTPAPDHIVVGLEPNFFVTESPVRTLDRELDGRTLFMSLSLSRILTHAELRTVLGHELGHYKGKDTEFSREFYPVYRGTTDALQSLAYSGGALSAQVALLPAAGILSFFLEAFAVAESEISRERELEADRIGAQVAGAAATAAALVKVHAFSRYWLVIREQMGDAMSRGKAFVNVSTIFAHVTAENASPQALQGLDESRLSHPTDSHPALSVRLESLGVTLDEAQVAALAVAPPEPAVTLVADAEKLEQQLSEVEHYLLAQSLGLVTDAPVPSQTAS
jgi:Zn-dependent protease with chaperone function